MKLKYPIEKHHRSPKEWLIEAGYDLKDLNISKANMAINECREYIHDLVFYKDSLSTTLTDVSMIGVIKERNNTHNYIQEAKECIIKLYKAKENASRGSEEEINREKSYFDRALMSED